MRPQGGSRGSDPPAGTNLQQQKPIIKEIP